MKTLSNHLTRITAIAALAAAGFVVQGAAHAATPQQQQQELRVVQLQEVVVTGKRIPVIQLEHVVVTGKRIAPAATMLAQRSAVVKAAKV